MGGKPKTSTPADKRLKENKSKPPATGGSGAWSSQNKPKQKGGK